MHQSVSRLEAEYTSKTRLTLSNSLSSIGVEEDALVLSQHGTNLLDRLDRADLIVEHHDLALHSVKEKGSVSKEGKLVNERWRTDRNEASLWPDGSFKYLEIDKTAGEDG